jgi:hypothetical protein
MPHHDCPGSYSQMLGEGIVAHPQGSLQSTRKLAVPLQHRFH